MNFKIHLKLKLVCLTQRLWHLQWLWLLEIVDKLIEIIAKTFQLSPSDINMDLTPNDIESWDSLLHLTLIHSIEEEFDIKLEIEEMFTIFKIGDIYNLLNTKGII